MVSDYLRVQHAFGVIGEAWENTIPHLQGFEAAFEMFKTDTLERRKQGLDLINAGLDKIGQNSELTAVAGHLSNAADSFAAVSGKLTGLVDEPSKLSAAFDSSMKNIQSLMGKVSAAELSTISTQLLDIGSQSAAGGPNAIADAFYNITSSVGDTSVRMDTLRAAIAYDSTKTTLGSAEQRKRAYIHRNSWRGGVCATGYP